VFVETRFFSTEKDPAFSVEWNIEPQAFSEMMKLAAHEQ
jgi:hypothetical protein